MPDEDIRRRPINEQVIALRHDFDAIKTVMEGQQDMLRRLADNMAVERDARIRMEGSIEGLDRGLYGQEGRGGDNEGDIGQLRGSVKRLITMSWAVLILLIASLISVAANLIYSVGKHP